MFVLERHEDQWAQLRHSSFVIELYVLLVLLQAQLLESLGVFSLDKPQADTHIIGLLSREGFFDDLVHLFRYSAFVGSFKDDIFVDDLPQEFLLVV